MWKYKSGSTFGWNRLKTIEMSQKNHIISLSKDKSDKRKEPSHEIKNGRSWKMGLI